MDDARLCLEVIRAAAEQGAHVANYVEAVGFDISGGRIQAVQAVDRVGGRRIVIRARQVVNVTGPWVDAVHRMAGDGSGPYLQPTKGVHVVLPALFPEGSEAKGSERLGFLLLHPADGRVFFVLPWMGKTLVGTTDTFTADGPDSLQVVPGEIDYLLAGYNRYFTVSRSPADVLGSFAGLRPLLRGLSADPSAITREFQIFTSPSGLLSVAGGKYTTYRHMAELIVDEVGLRLGQRRRCRTHDFPLDGAPQQPWTEFFDTEVTRLSRHHGLSPESAAHLVNRYGRRATDVAAYLDDDPNAAKAILPGEPDLRVELAYQREQEMAVYPADHWLRRTRLLLVAARAVEKISLPIPQGKSGNGGGS
jgi:glycerol-3-phosphate dehydrogenase